MLQGFKNFGQAVFVRVMMTVGMGKPARRDPGTLHYDLSDDTLTVLKSDGVTVAPVGGTAALDTAGVDARIAAYNYSPIIDTRVGVYNFDPKIAAYLRANMSTVRPAYVEPADPWTAYAWTDGMLTIDLTWLKNNCAQIWHRGQLKWLVTGLIRRNMVDGQCAVRVMTQEIVLFRNCSFLGVGSGGQGNGIVGSSTQGDCRVEFEDCSFYGPRTQMVTGQWPGQAAKFQYFKRLRMDHCNFIYTCAGAAAPDFRGSSDPYDGVYVTDCYGYQMSGLIRDTTTGTGYRTGNSLTTDFQRSQFVQVTNRNSAQLNESIYIGWNLNVQRPDKAIYIDDVVNLYGVTMSAANYAIVEHNCIDGAYSHLYDQTATAYSGGGIMLGDGGGQYLKSLNNVILNTSNYGSASSGGDNQSHTGNIVIGTGRTPDDVYYTAGGDNGIYLRPGGTPTNVTAIDNYVRFGQPTAGSPATRADLSLANGATASVQTGNAGAVAYSEVTAAATAWQLRRLEAGRGVVGRRVPA